MLHYYFAFMLDYRAASQIKNRQIYSSYTYLFIIKWQSNIKFIKQSYNKQKWLIFKHSIKRYKMTNKEAVSTFHNKNKIELSVW